MKPLQKSLIAAIQLYRWIISPAKSALFGPFARCRFTPSCSEYALLAVQRHGSLTGTSLAVRRLASCHPWGGCGFDPVPEIEPRRRRPFAMSFRSGTNRAPTSISSR